LAAHGVAPPASAASAPGPPPAARLRRPLSERRGGGGALVERRLLWRGADERHDCERELSALARPRAALSRPVDFRAAGRARPRLTRFQCAALASTRRSSGSTSGSSAASSWKIGCAMPPARRAGETRAARRAG
jgi:hypothetical protein